MPLYYRVRKGDYLTKIAALPCVYGTWKHWRVIYEANRDKLPVPSDCDLIYPDIILTIPSLNGEKRSGTY